MNERGQGAVEYTGIVVLLVIVSVVILAVLGEQIASVLNTIKAELGFTSFDPVTVQDADALASAQDILERGGYMALPIMAEAEAYSDLPFTLDAKTHHTGQKWDAKGIAKHFDARGCTPQIDICEEFDIEIHWCKMNDKKAIALVIGHTVRQIVTGYMGDLKYWSNKCP